MELLPMNRLFLAVIPFVAVGLGAWYFLIGPGSDMSGSYIGKNADQAFLVQMVQGASGQLSGFYEEAGFSADGSALNQDNIPFTGQRDGKTFIITFAPTGLSHFFIGSISLSGIYSGSTISLNGQDNNLNIDLNLAKGDADTYAHYVAVLRSQAQAVRHMRAQRTAAEEEQAEKKAVDNEREAAAENFENKIATDLKLMANVKVTLAARLMQLGSVANQLKITTIRMQNAQAHENALGDAPSVQGDQISAEILQANANETAAIINIRNHLNMIEQNGVPALLKHIEAEDLTCKGLNATERAATFFDGPRTELEDCLALQQATPILERQVSQLLNAYQNVFATWDLENKK